MAAGSPLPFAPDPASGRTLGKYEVLCRLSAGGMSEIFLAFQKGLGGFRKLVVLKQILPDISGEEEFVRMFLDEAKITAAFAHPNIAQVFDLDVQEGTLFLAMEFVQGATLVEIAKACRQQNQPIPLGLTLAAVRDTALALNYAHTFTDPSGKFRQVIHRDVAEKNVMVNYEGVTKLLDFGIAKHLGKASRTTVGMVKGTSGYMSPEQILGEQLDPRSDLFSLGVVLHECMTGMRLFHGKTAEDGMIAPLREEIPLPSRQNKAVTPELDAVALRALAKRRDDRYATTLEFARALERAAGALLWHPEQCGEFVSKLFFARREETRVLLSRAQSTGDSTGEIRLSQFLSPDAKPPNLPENTAPPEEYQADEPTPLHRPVRDKAARPRTNPKARVPDPVPVDEDFRAPDPADLTVLDIPNSPATLELRPAPAAQEKTLVASEDTQPAVLSPFFWNPRNVRLLAAVALVAFALALLGGYLWLGVEPSSPTAPKPSPPSSVAPHVAPETVVIPSPSPEEATPPQATATSATSEPPPPAQAREETASKPAPTPPPVKPAAARPPPAPPRKPEPVKPAPPQEKKPSEPPPPTTSIAQAFEEPKPAPTGIGMLSLSSDRQATVLRLNQVLGPTPLKEQPLPVGKHTIRLQSGEKTYLLPITIKEGEVLKKNVTLDKLDVE